MPSYTFKEYTVKFFTFAQALKNLLDASVFYSQLSSTASHIFTSELFIINAKEEHQIGCLITIGQHKRCNVPHELLHLPRYGRFLGASGRGAVEADHTLKYPPLATLGLRTFEPAIHMKTHFIKHDMIMNVKIVLPPTFTKLFEPLHPPFLRNESEVQIGCETMIYLKQYTNSTVIPTNKRLI